MLTRGPAFGVARDTRGPLLALRQIIMTGSALHDGLIEHLGLIRGMLRLRRHDMNTLPGHFTAIGLAVQSFVLLVSSNEDAVFMENLTGFTADNCH